MTLSDKHTLDRTALDKGFEPAIPGSERPQTHALDRAATGIGSLPHSLQANFRALSLPYLFSFKCIIHYCPVI